MSCGEMIDVLDDDGNVISTVTREEAERDNHKTENVLIFIFNSLGKVWVQLRPSNKSHYPGRWDISACGGILSGESPDQAAERETYEETGLRPKLQFVKSFLNIFPGDNGEERRRFSHLYIGISDEMPQPNEEVDEFKDWEPSELREDATRNEASYVPSIIVELDIALEAYKQLV